MKPQLLMQTGRDAIELFAVFINVGREAYTSSNISKLKSQIEGIEKKVIKWAKDNKVDMAIDGHDYYGKRESWDGEKLLVSRKIKAKHEDIRKIESQLKHLGFREGYLNQIGHSHPRLAAMVFKIFISSKPLNFKRRLKQRWNSEPEKKRYPTPPPTIRHKDERDVSRQRIKENIKKDRDE